MCGIPQPCLWLSILLPLAGFGPAKHAIIAKLLGNSLPSSKNLLLSALETDQAQFSPMDPIVYATGESNHAKKRLNQNTRAYRLQSLRYFCHRSNRADGTNVPVELPLKHRIGNFPGRAMCPITQVSPFLLNRSSHSRQSRYAFMGREV